MTYQGSEVSVSSAKPVELYKFVGTYANFFYTSGPQAITFLGDTYLPIAIKRSEVKTGTQEDDGLDLTVDLPVSSDLAQTYGFSGTPPKLSLTIYRYHRGAPGDYVAYWTGPVSNINTTGGKSTIRSPSLLASALQGNVPNVYYQGPCNHTLFDARCAVVEEDWTVVTAVSAIDATDAKKITVVSVGTLDGKLIGGELSMPSGERRMITAQVGNVVTVNFPFFALVPGTAIALVAGCDHAYGGDCSASKFANQPRFGGFPFIPSDNIFSSGLTPGTSIPDATCLPGMWTPRVFPGWTFKFSLAAYPITGSTGLIRYPAIPTWIATDTTNGLSTGNSLSRRAAHDCTVDTFYNLLSAPYIVAPLNAGYDFAGFDFYAYYAHDPGPIKHDDLDLRLQFPSGGVWVNTTTHEVNKGGLSVRHWTEDVSRQLAPSSTTSGQTIFGDGTFNLRSLWPDDWYFAY